MFHAAPASSLAVARSNSSGTSDVEAPEWPFEPVVDDTQTFEVLVPIDDDGEIIAEVDDFRGKDCDVVLPEVAKSLGEIKEER